MSKESKRATALAKRAIALALGLDPDDCVISIKNEMLGIRFKVEYQGDPRKISFPASIRTTSVKNTAQGYIIIWGVYTP